MNILLIVRPEILAIFIIIFLMLYNFYYSRYRGGKDHFFVLAMMCLGHDVMALITEITVNMENIPRVINDTCHILLYLSSLFYSMKYFEYALSLVMSDNQMKKYRMMVYAVTIVEFTIMLISPIYYLQGKGTKYSVGTGPTLCYVSVLFLFITSNIIMLCNRKKINDTIVHALFPLSFTAIGLITVQILIPEFLFTGSALALITVGVFFAMENPIGKFGKRVFIDHNTQIWNRNCYEYDLENTIGEKIKSGEYFACVMVDINGLKRVNDSLGHLYGDKLIESVVNTLNITMVNAFRIYRIGGDEFIIIYFNKSSEIIKNEIELASQRCNVLHKDENISFGASFGYAERYDDESVLETIQRADAKMYCEKERFYKESGIERRK